VLLSLALLVLLWLPRLLVLQLPQHQNPAPHQNRGLRK
jgi:hypothetical protein